MHEVWHSPCGRMELRLGRWQDVLSDVTECDAVITDPPYSERTHAGHNAMESQMRSATGQATRQAVSYEAMKGDDAGSLTRWAASLARGWLFIMTDDELAHVFKAAALMSGRYAFPPVAIIIKRPRLLGDGPACWLIHGMASRPRSRTMSTWGCLPGSYQYPSVSIPGIVGAKHIGLMREIIRDYSRPGDLIVDPYAGSGTTLLAAAMEGRRCIGAEMDPDTFALAVKRLSKGYTESLFGRGEKTNLKQRELL